MPALFLEEDIWVSCIGSLCSAEKAAAPRNMTRPVEAERPAASSNGSEKRDSPARIAPVTADPGPDSGMLAKLNIPACMSHESVAENEQGLLCI